MKKIPTVLIFFTLLSLQRPLICGSSRVSKSKDQNHINTKEINISFDDNSLKLKDNFTTLPSDFKYFLNIVLANFNEKEVESKNNFTIDIESDLQKEIDSIFIAEGNVIVRTNNAVMRADEFKYDRNLNKLYIDGNIKFKTNSQFFIAKKIEYDFLNKKGFISDVYGSIDFDGLADINLNSKKNITINDDFSESSRITELKLNNTSRFSLGNIFTKKNSNNSNNSNESFFKNLSEKSFDLKIKEVTNTRFSTEKININGNQWQSDIMLLTNDPFNYPQVIILNNDFKILFEEERISGIETKSSNLVLDKRVTIPLGKQRIKLDEEQNARWGIGYDNKKYDGLYIYRNSDPIEFNKKNKTKLYLKKRFFIQRSIFGKTKSFPKKDESSLSTKVEQDANWLDYFGLVGTFVTDINEWKYFLELDSNSLDLERFDNAFKSRTILTKNLAKIIKDGSFESRDFTFFGSYRDITKNGSLGERIINTSYGSRYDIKKIKGNQSSEYILSFGNYEAESQINSSLISSYRANISLKRNIIYPIWEPKVKAAIDNTHLYNPSIVRKGLFFDVETIFDFFRYEDNLKQDMIQIKAGPRFIYGDFTKKYFDYSELSIYPRYKFNRGKSPFSFDQIVDNSAVVLSAKQQIYGPLTFKFNAEINIEDDFEGDRLINPTIDLGINRRAYNVNLFYNLETEAGGLNFKIHSFKFKGLGEKFR